MSKGDLLTESQIKKLISSNYEWDLREGILICMGMSPQSYDWDNPDVGNDLPIRILTDFQKAIRTKKLIETQVVDKDRGLYKLQRDDIIVFFFNHWPATGERTHAIWAAHKRTRQPKSIKGCSKLEADMDIAFKNALLKEYRKDPSLYNINPRRLVKERLYDRILKEHPEWDGQREALRRSGKKFTVAWAKTTLASEGK